MKKSIILIVWLFLFFNAIGQIPFAPLGAKYFFKSNLPIFYFEYEITKDTLLLGKTSTVIDFMTGPGCNGFGQKYFVYQDEEKVFVYDEESDNFQMIYDFDLPIDSSYRVNVCQDFWGSDSITVIVTGYDNDYQFLEIKPDNPIWSQFSEIKIGVGHTLSTLLLLAPWTDSWSTLLCYETPTTGIIHINGNYCGPDVTIEKNKNGSELQVNLYPNPTNLYFNLTFNQPFMKPTNLGLYNVAGQKVKQWDVNIGQLLQTFSLEDLPNGLYFWKLKDEQNLIGSGKLIILQ